MIKAVIFDFFGVVCAPLSPQTGADFCRQHGLDPVAFAEFGGRQGLALDLGQMSQEQFAAAVISHFELKLSPEEVAAELYRLDAHHYRARPEIIKIITQLKPQVKVVLMSNISQGSAKHLRSLGAYDIFDHVYLSSDYGLTKPNIKWYELVQADLKISDNSQLMLTDDDPVNIDAALAAGWVKSFAYTDPTSVAEHLRQLGFELDLPAPA